MRIDEILAELQLPKNKWDVILSNHDKNEAGDNLVDLVQKAYSTTPQGSFVNSVRDVMPSDWVVIDWDEETDIDACVFYRNPRPGEKWRGKKIQGLGHDGQRTSKDKVIQKTIELLNQQGTWIEASDAVAHILRKSNVPVVTDEKQLQLLFNDPSLKMVDDTSYTRQIGNQTIQEIVFGRPVV